MSDPASATDQPPRSLRAVALLEAIKGLIALTSVAGLLTVGPDALRDWLQSVLAHFNLLPPTTHASTLLAVVSAHNLHLAALLLGLYASLRLIESWGRCRYRWASWFGVIGAAAYLPFELRALWQHPHWLTLGVLLINLLIVWILLRDLRRRA